MITRIVDGKLSMRCLTLKQPYAYFMFDLPPEYLKDVENRSRSITSMMGPLLISTSARVSAEYFDNACEAAVKRGVPESLLPKIEQLELGVLYGCINLKCLLPSTSLQDQFYRWKFPGHVGYVVDKELRLPSRPLRGQQTLFYVDLNDEEQQLLREAQLLP